MTRVPCSFSIARIACARRTTYHRAANRGCKTMITIKIQKSVEKSNDMTSACVLSEGIFQMTAGLCHGILVATRGSHDLSQMIILPKDAFDPRAMSVAQSEHDEGAQ